MIVEPVAANMGVVPPAPGYLEGLRELTSRHGALLIFDEVITGFRVALGGATARYGVTPDLTVLGKIIGGGLPVGAYGGRADLMGLVAPDGPVYQAGTLSGNPLAMAAGAATLRELTPQVYTRLEEAGEALESGPHGRRERGGRIGPRSAGVGSLLTAFVDDFPTLLPRHARRRSHAPAQPARGLVRIGRPPRRPARGNRPRSAQRLPSSSSRGPMIDTATPATSLDRRGPLPAPRSATSSPTAPRSGSCARPAAAWPTTASCASATRS